MKYGDLTPANVFAASTFTGNQLFPLDVNLLKSRGVLHARGLVATGTANNNNTSTFTSLGAGPRSLTQNTPTVVAGGFEACAYIHNGQLYTWGTDTNSVLGRTVTTGEPAGIPNLVAGSWSTVSAGFSFMAGIRTNGTLWSWGSNSTAKTGQNTTAGTTTVPTQIGTDTDWKMVACSGSAAIAVKNDNSVWTWGLGIVTGQNLSSGNVLTPTRVTSLDGLGEVTWVSASNSVNVMGIIIAGRLYTTGVNTNFMTGLGTSTGNTITFTQVGSATNWQKVYFGEGYACAINTSGHLFGWGTSANWTTGGGIFGGSPTTAATGPTVRHLNTRLVHSACLLGTAWNTNDNMFVLTDGTVITTGAGDLYGLGKGTTNPANGNVMASFAGASVVGSRSGALMTTYDLPILTNPASLVSSTAPDGGVALVWADNNSSETGFRVYRSSTAINTSNPPAVYATVGQNAFSYVDSVANGQTFSYAVSVYRDGDNSELFSNVVSGTGSSPLSTIDAHVYLPLNANYLDRSTSAQNVTAGSGATLQTATTRFGGGAVQLNGTRNAFVEWDNFPSTTSFTLEFWYNMTSHNQDFSNPFGYRSSGSTGFILGFQASTGLYCWRDNGVIIAGTGGIPSLNTWHHVALVRDTTGSTLRLFLDGVLMGTRTSFTGTISYPGVKPRIGADQDVGAVSFLGFMDDVLLSNTAKYSTNFTPPTTSFL